ncbi:21396_t:CDS:1, partial [Dentiscutata erythropus]
RIQKKKRNYKNKLNERPQLPVSRPTEQQQTPFTRLPARILNQEQVQSLANDIRNNQRNNRQFQGIGTGLPH